MVSVVAVHRYATRRHTAKKGRFGMQLRIHTRRTGLPHSKTLKKTFGKANEQQTCSFTTLPLLSRICLSSPHNTGDRLYESGTLCSNITLDGSICSCRIYKNLIKQSGFAFAFLSHVLPKSNTRMRHTRHLPRNLQEIFTVS